MFSMFHSFFCVCNFSAETDTREAIFFLLFPSFNLIKLLFFIKLTVIVGKMSFGEKMLKILLQLIK